VEAVGDTARDRGAPRKASAGDFVLVAGKGVFVTHALSKGELRIAATARATS